MTGEPRPHPGIDGEKIAHVFYDIDDELTRMEDEYNAVCEQFPVLRRDLGLNERGGLFRWLGILEVVSLERTAPYLSAFGLPGCDAGALRRVAQAALEAIYPLQDDEAVPLAAIVEILEAALDRLAKEAGGACAEAVYEFGLSRYPNSCAESRRESDWHRLFRQLVFAPGARYPTVEPALSPAALDTVQRAVLRHIDFDLNERSYADDRQPLSPWEEVVYARYEGDNSPFDTMSETAYYFQAQAAWSAIEAELTPAEVERLVDWGRLQAAVLPGMRPDRIAPLPTPRRPRRQRPQATA